VSTTAISREQALRIAHEDGIRAYRDLSGLHITIALEDDGWHVDYELTDPRMNGGGPHYIIDARSGAIVWKRYDQCSRRLPILG
jgi:hypothetical protein